MKIYPHSSLLAAILLAITHLTNAITAGTAVGVGFELTLDYGVSSVYFDNGTFADVTKIEGGPSYKALTRDTSADADWGLQQGSMSQKQMFGASSWRDKLPPWLGGYDNVTKALIRMTAALKVATESFLERPIDTVEFGFPASIPEESREKMRTAASDQSLSSSFITRRPAGYHAAQVYDAFGKCPPGSDPEWGPECYPPRLILTVEYSRGSLDATVIVDTDEFPDTRMEIHHPTLGADAIEECRRDNSPEVCLSQLEYGLRLIARLPFEHPYGKPITFFSQLVLHGEAADDVSLNEVLKKILRDPDGSMVKTSFERSDGVTPLYAASRGLAQDCHFRMTYDESKLGCLIG